MLISAIVIKNLGEDIKGKQGIIGSAIMSNGMPSFILDLFEMYRDDLKKSQGYQELQKGAAGAA